MPVNPKICRNVQKYAFNQVQINAASPFHVNSDHLQRLLTTVMPYGKHKGLLIADLPGPYLNWFARVGFPAGEIGQLLALMQELDHNGLSSLLDPLRKQQTTQIVR